MKNAVHSWVHTLIKDKWHLGRRISHLSVQTKLDSFFKPALLRSKTSTTSESFVFINTTYIIKFFICVLSVFPPLSGLLLRHSSGWSLLIIEGLLYTVNNFMNIFSITWFVLQNPPSGRWAIRRATICSALIEVVWCWSRLQIYRVDENLCNHK
jgi:hypothetical protein